MVAKQQLIRQEYNKWIKNQAPLEQNKLLLTDRVLKLLVLIYSKQ
jgi:hypothetical protein